MKPSDAWRDTAFDRLIARGLEEDRDAAGNACPDADLLAAWFDRSLSQAEAARIEVHAAGCASCQHILADLARTEPAVVRAAPPPAPAKPWHWHWRWLVPLATATLVVVVVGSRTLRAPGALQSAALVETAAPSGTVARLNEASPAASLLPSRPPSSSPGAPASVSPSPGAPASEPARQHAPAPTLKDVAPRADAAPAAPRRELAANAPAESGGRAAGMTRARPEPAPQAAAESIGAVAAPAPAAQAAPSAAKTFGIAVGVSSYQVRAPSGTAAWRWGAGGRVERSADAGRTWHTQESGVTARLVAGSAPSDRVCWIVGDGGVVLRTTDGATWQAVSSPVSTDLVAVRATSDLAATITGRDGAEFTTADGGRSWKRHEE